jgi:hypothetical protein
MSQAISQRWPISSEFRAEIVAEMLRILREDDDTENRVKAARILVAAEKQNQDDTLKKKSSQVRIDNMVQLSTQPAEVDWEYLEWKKKKLLAETTGETTSVAAPSDQHLSGVPDQQQPLLAWVERVRKTEGHQEQGD